MGFTIEDMLLVSRDRYKMELVAGKEGWSNSISWLIMLEDRTIIRNFSGKELAVTTGLGFTDTPQLLTLLQDLYEQNASGLIINAGYYIREIPDEVIAYCDSVGFPLLTVPWDVYLVDMIKDLSIRVFLQGTTDDQISQALITAIEHPQDRKLYEDALLANFDIEGTFQVFLVTTDGLASMDSVDRRRLAYRLQLNLTNLTHNGHFFYYDGCFAVIMNAVSVQDAEMIISGFTSRIKLRMPKRRFTLGIGSRITGIEQLCISWQRARSALRMAKAEGKEVGTFDEMGLFRLLYSVQDQALLQEMGPAMLRPLLEYDQKHDSNYTDTLECYLRCGGSIQQVAEQMFIHRNTINYRMNSIRALIGSSLETEEERLAWLIACTIRHMDLHAPDQPEERSSQ